jgi:hypothetical protein
MREVFDSGGIRVRDGSVVDHVVADDVDTGISTRVARRHRHSGPGAPRSIRGLVGARRIALTCLGGLLALGCSTTHAALRSPSPSTAHAAATTAPALTSLPATSAPATTEPVGNAYCGTRTGAPTTTKLMVVYEENHDASSIYGSSSAPNIDRYAADCGSAQNYQALTHPSLPNYMASTSGVSYASPPWTGDCDPGGNCLSGDDNIFDQVGPTGWKGYAESMTSNCQAGSSGTYAARHDPALYYTDVSAQCPTNDVPMGTTSSGALHTDVVDGTLPTFSTVTPNLDDDMHDGTVAQGDTWLAGWIDQIVAGPDYRSGRLGIVVVWDEGSGDGDVASNVAMIAMSPYVVPGTRSSTYFTHYSLLRAAEDVAGVPGLAGAATANSLRTAFGF